MGINVSQHDRRRSVKTYLSICMWVVCIMASNEVILWSMTLIGVTFYYLLNQQNMMKIPIFHTCMLQILCLTGSPRQPFGARHRRNCWATPPSQEREHVDHSDHDDHPMFLTRF